MNDVIRLLALLRISAGAVWRLLLILFLLVTPLVARAHGGGTPQLVNEPAGPYVISAWTTPDPPTVGELHITVAVAEPGAGREAGPPVLGATVEVHLTHDGAEQPVVSKMASNEDAANKLFYETDLAVPEAGPYRVQVDVDGPQGSGQAVFDLRAEAAEEFNWPLVSGLGLAFVVALFAVNAWRGRDRQEPQPELYD